MNPRFVRNLRANMTREEELLWMHLRGHRFFGFKFRRQQPIGPFVADFVCFSRRLVIELDGSQHAVDPSRDKRRDEWFFRRGYRVLRFWNSQVTRELDITLGLIYAALQAPSPGFARSPSATKLSHPLPRGERA